MGKYKKSVTTELSEIIAKTLVQNPEVSDKLSALMGGRMNAASLERVKVVLNTHERRQIARRTFNKLNERQQQKSLTHA